MRQAFLIFMAAAAECFAVDTVPVLSWTVDCQAPAAFIPDAIVSGETVVFQPQYKLNGRVLTLTNAVAVALQFRLSGETNAPYSLDGTIYNATNGQVRITWPSSNVVAAGAYDYKVLITGDNTANLRAFGQLTVDAGFGSATGSPPPYVTLVTSGMVAAAVAAHDADSNTVHGGFILTAYQTGTNAWNNATNALAQISAHLVESWQTVHGGYILTAWQTATNALAIAQQAFTWSDPTNGYVTASVTNGLVGAPTFQAFTGTVLTAESDPVYGSTSTVILAHVNSSHGVTEGRGFWGGYGAIADTGGGAIGDSAVADTGGAAGNLATTRRGGAIGHEATSMDGGAVGRLAFTVTGGAMGYMAASTNGGAIGSNAVSSSGGSVGESAKTSDGFAGGKNAFSAEDAGGNVGDGIDAVQLGTGWNTNPLSLQIYGYPLMNPDGTIPLARTPSLLATNGNGAGLTGITASQVGAVQTNRTITVNGQVGTLDSNVTFTVTGSTDAPAWIAATNTETTITLTNDLERPQYLYATGAVSLAFAGLRPPQPFYLVVRGPDSLAFPSGTHFVGGASWQTNQANHFIVWQYSTNLYVNPVTTSTED